MGIDDKYIKSLNSQTPKGVLRTSQSWEVIERKRCPVGT